MGQKLRNNEHGMLAKTSDYTITIQDVREGTVIVADTSSNTVDLTLPQLSTLPADGVIREFYIGHNAGTNLVKLLTHSGDTFIYSNTFFELGTLPFFYRIAGVNDGSNQRWGLQSRMTVKGSFHRDANWASGNFSSMTIIPWDSEHYNNNDDLLVYTSGASARVTVKTAGSYLVSYMIDLDSTGGITWNATSKVYKNGSALDNTEVRTGNYGSEDQSMALIPTYVDLVADDYLDLRIDQNNLTGNLVHSVFNVELTL